MDSIKFTVSNNVSQLINQDNPNMLNIRVFRLGNTVKISQPGRLEAAIHWFACKLKIEKEITGADQIRSEGKINIQGSVTAACKKIIDKSQDEKIKGICQKLLSIACGSQEELPKTAKAPVSNKSEPSSPQKELPKTVQTEPSPIGKTLVSSTSSKPSSSDEQSNSQLAKKIIDESRTEDVKKICSGDFLVDPTDHLVHLMIERGAGRCQMDDSARQFVVARIPGFIDKVSSPEYLRAFAQKHIKHRDKDDFMHVFEKSLSTDAFKKDLQAAVDQFKRLEDKDDPFSGMQAYEAENRLRTALTIFRQSEALEVYSFPVEAMQESARVK